MVQGSRREQLRRFGRGGYVKIALRARVPVVPAAIVRSEESLPLLARLPAGALGMPYLPLTLPPLPARWQLRFGEPFDFSQAPPGSEDDSAFIERANEQVRDGVQALLAELLATRGSVF